MRTDVTDKEIEKALGIEYVGRYWDDDRDMYVVDFDGDMVLTYDTLRAYSRIFHTRNINIEYESDTGPYSEVTPGDPSRFRVVIGKRK